MQSAENELLVEAVSASSGASLFEDVADSNSASFSLKALQETLIKDSKKSSTPEPEGNINCAMDLFAPDQSSVSSSNSRVSSSSTLEPHHLSSSSEPKDTSDSDRVGQFKVKLGNSYMTLLNEHDQQDAMSVTSDSSYGEGKSQYGRGLYSPKNSPSAPTHPTRLRTSSPHFPSSSITFPSAGQPKLTMTKKWTVFEEDKENKLPSADRPKLVPARPPPAIPDRKSIRSKPTGMSSPVASSSLSSSHPNTDLLLDFSEPDIYIDPIPPPVKPAIPPRRSLFSTSSTASGSGSYADESDQDLIPVSRPECHVNPTQVSSGSSSPTEFLQPNPPQRNIAPPIPPRKEVKTSSMTNTDSNIGTNNSLTLISLDSDFDMSSNFASFPDTTEKTKMEFSLDGLSPSPCWVNFDDSPVTSAKTVLLQVTDTDGMLVPEEKTQEQDVVEERESSHTDENAMANEEDMLWKDPSSSPDVRSSTKKKVSGIGYLCLENDDFDNSSSTEHIDYMSTAEPVLISLPENDKSPEKPQSQWATFQNEEDEEEHNGNDNTNVDNISCSNSSPSFGMNSGLADSINDVDADLEDDFGLGINRLSTDMPDLKGFNRADKGSQNNLVDFSDDRGSAAASTGSRENIDDDDDVETIFDLTAQGDSLKRRRPKQAAVEKESTEELDLGSKDSKVSKDAPYHVGPAGMNEDAVLVEEKEVFVSESSSEQSAYSSLSSRTNTPASAKLDSNLNNKPGVSTNPFWSSPSANASDSTSFGSLIDSPFDKVVFKAPISASEVPQSPAKPTTPSHSSTTASPLPSNQLFKIPPPPSSRSSMRSRRSSSLAKDRIRNLSHGSSSVKKLDLDSASDVSIKADSLPSSRAETPNITPLKSDNQVQSNEPSVPDTCVKTDDSFDPFFTQTSSEVDGGTSLFPSEPFSHVVEKKNENLFEWVDKLSETKKLDSSPPLDDLVFTDSEEAKKEVFVMSDMELSTGTGTANVDDQEIMNTHDDQLDIEIPETLDDTPKVETPDPLQELKKATSVESPNGLEVSAKVFLPEVEIIKNRTSWDVFMRFPREKRAMSNRKWVPIHIKLICDEVTNPLVKLYYTSKVKEPFHTVSLASHQMQLSKPKLQAHYSDEGQVLGKLHAVKLMVVNYKEKQTFSPRRSLSRNPSGFKHSCRGKQSIKFGFTSHHDIVSFCKSAHDAMFDAHRRLPKLKDEEHSATVKYHSRDELLIDVCDELQAVVSESGSMEACKLRVYLHASSFLSGDPMAKITLNDKKMKGKEVVRREDIIPTSNDAWIDIRDPQLHESCTADSYRNDSDEHAGVCEFYPPDACKFELMRFSTSYAEEELPVTIKASINVKGARLQLRCIIRMSSKHSANKDPLTQIACEDVMIRFPVPDEWGGFFRVDGRFRNHSVRAKRAAKQRCRPSSEAGVTMEASVGVAKYEHAYRAIVWRLPRLPEKNEVQNTPSVFTCRIELSSDQDLGRLRNPPDNEESKGDGYRGGLNDRFRWCEVEYTMPGPTASNVCVRSISLPNTDRAEKFVCYQSHYLYKVGMSLSAEPVGADGEEDVGTSLCTLQ